MMYTFCRSELMYTQCIQNVCIPGFELADCESRIVVHFKIFVDPFSLFFIKFAVQNTPVVQTRD